MWRAPILLPLATLLSFCIGSAEARERTVTVGVPAGPLTQIVEVLASAFRAETGITVRPTSLGPDASLPTINAQAAILPRRVLERLEPAVRESPRIVFHGDVILVGSRAERARVRGLKDIRTALRWIASARGTYVSSSAALGVRELELALWDEVGVNVQVRSTWYIEAKGDEDGVFRKAGELGAYVLIERVTWAAQTNRHGLQVLVEGDPALRSSYASHLVQAEFQEARAWHDWLLSARAQAAIAGFSLHGTRVFTPTNGSGAEGLPSRS